MVGVVCHYCRRGCHCYFDHCYDHICHNDRCQGRGRIQPLDHLAKCSDEGHVSAIFHTVSSDPYRATFKKYFVPPALCTGEAILEVLYEAQRDNLLPVLVHGMDSHNFVYKRCLIMLAPAPDDFLTRGNHHSLRVWDTHCSGRIVFARSELVEPGPTSAVNRGPWTMAQMTRWAPELIQASGGQVNGTHVNVPPANEPTVNGTPVNGAQGNTHVNASLVNGTQVNGAQVNGAQVGEQVGGVHVNGVHVNGTQVNGSPVNGTQTDESQTDESQTDASQTDVSQTNDTQANGTQVNEIQVNETQVNGTYVNGTHVTGDEAASSD